MPKVGKKEFAYTSEGIEQAKQYAEETGFPISNAMDRNETYEIGGIVNPVYKKGGKVK